MNLADFRAALEVPILSLSACFQDDGEISANSIIGGANEPQGIGERGVGPRKIKSGRTEAR